MDVEGSAVAAGAHAAGHRAAWMTLGGAALLLFAAVHTVWTGFHAPLAAWVAPLGVGLLAEACGARLRSGRCPGWRLPLWS